MIYRNTPMKIIFTASFSVLIYLVFEIPTLAVDMVKGEAGFKENCAECHSGGGNIVNPNKTLSEKDRNTNGIKTADDIVRIMRKPGEGMTKFDEKTISDDDARNIAEYVTNTFK
jgi:cytochrome c6